MMSKAKMLVVLSLTALLSLMAWVLYRYYNEQYYGQYGRYSGKAKIDDYEIIADGAGAIVHWTSTTPEEDRKMKEFGSYRFFSTVQTGSTYLLRQNVKLKDYPYYLKEQPSEGSYWTLSVYHVNGKKLEEEKELDLYKVVEDYNSDYLPAELGGIYTWKGEEYLRIQIWDLKDSERTKPVFLNLKTRKIEENEILAQNNKRKPQVSPIAAYWWDKKKSGISIIPNGEEFSLDKSFLEKTRFNKASKAYQLLEQEGTRVSILNSQNNTDQFAREAAVYSLFMPTTVNAYENVTIPPELSTDGQEHIVQSKEEFDQYYDIEKARKLYHETE